MQIIILLISFSLISLKWCNAQVPNGDFELWEIASNIAKPVKWETNNSNFHTPVMQELDAIQGNYSLRISSTASGIEGLGPGWTYISFEPSSIYSALIASVDIDSIEMGKVIIEIWEIFENKNKLIGKWVGLEETNGYSDIFIPIKQDHQNLLRIKISAENIPGTAGPSRGYAEAIIDDLRFSKVPLNDSDVNVRNKSIRVAYDHSGCRLNIDFASNNCVGSKLALIDLKGLVQFIEEIPNDQVVSISTQELKTGIYYLQLQELGCTWIIDKIFVQN